MSKYSVFVALMVVALFVFGGVSAHAEDSLSESMTTEMNQFIDSSDWEGVLGYVGDNNDPNTVSQIVNYLLQYSVDNAESNPDSAVQAYYTALELMPEGEAETSELALAAQNALGDALAETDPAAGGTIRVVVPNINMNNTSSLPSVSPF